jgi:hypothetical protein
MRRFFQLPRGPIKTAAPADGAERIHPVFDLLGGLSDLGGELVEALFI